MNDLHWTEWLQTILHRFTITLEKQLPDYSLKWQKILASQLHFEDSNTRCLHSIPLIWVPLEKYIGCCCETQTLICTQTSLHKYAVPHKCHHKWVRNIFIMAQNLVVPCMCNPVSDCSPWAGLLLQPMFSWQSWTATLRIPIIVFLNTGKLSDMIMNTYHINCH